MRLRGQPAYIAKIEHYFKRKGISIEDILSSASPPPSKTDLVCRSPSPATVSPTEQSVSLMVATTSAGPYSFHEYPTAVSGVIPPRMEAPDGLKIVEYLFADVQDYVMNLFHVYQVKKPLGIPSTLVAFHLSVGLLECSLLGHRRLREPSEGHNVIFSCLTASDSYEVRRDLQNRVIHSMAYTNQAATTRRPSPLCPEIRHKTLFSLGKDGTIVPAAILTRLASALQLLVENGDPIALILRSLWTVIIDNLEYLMSRQRLRKSWGPISQTLRRMINLRRVRMCLPRPQGRHE